MSLLASEFTYSALAKLHHSAYKGDTSSVSKSEADEEEEQSGQADEVAKKIEDGIISDRFRYPVTRYIFRKAREHYQRHKYGLAPMPKTKIARWTWDADTIEAIVDFVTDPLNTQQVAYGSLRTRDAFGKLTRVARVIRLHQKSILVTLLQKYLKEGRGMEKIPSRSSLYRILSNMPSA